jgi:5-methyltetrahydropteroyltriglutamate--homocysteine methyltransferase
MAFTATKNVPLAATTTGSWPRPAWYGQSLWGRPLDTAMLDPIYREQFSDALAVVVSDQERAGLDIVTCGDYFLDADLAGRSWHHYPLQRWRGVAYDELQPEGTRSDLLKYPPGTLLNEIYTSWRWPIVTGKIEHNPRNPLEYAKIYRMTQARTRKPVKFGTVSGQVMALFLDSHTPEYRIEDDKRQMIWDMASAINRELRELVASGCSVIQVEEPTIHFIACYHPEAKDTLNFLTEALNHELEGLDNAEVWIHTCWGNPMMQRVFDKTSYARQDAQEICHRRRLAPHAERRDARRGCQRHPQGFAIHRHRKSCRHLRLRVWPPGRQSPGCVLQKRGGCSGRECRAPRAWPGGNLRAVRGSAAGPGCGAG